ncbi:MAG: zf-HC2 domain-containing protein [Clostridia bacterium]|nr:zf-HC2 domain-containing protein [Clostridia bacterium]
MADKVTGDLCQKARELMFDYADGTLSEKDAAWLEAHITSCPDCAAELAGCRETLKLIKASRYEAPFSITDAVMNKIEKEEVKSPLASAFTGFFKKKNFARYGTIAAALVLVAVVVLNHDAIFRMTRGLTSSNEAADAAEANYRAAQDMAAYSYTAVGETGVDETVQHVETVAGMMMASPTASGTGSATTEAETEAVQEEVKSTSKRYGDSGSDTEASAAPVQPSNNSADTFPETGAVPEIKEGEDSPAPKESVEEGHDADSAPVVDSQDDELYREIETSVNLPEEDIILYYDTPAEYYGNIIAYLNVSDVNSVMSVLGLTEYKTLENEDGSESILCVYTLSERDDIIDFLRLTNINYAVHYNENELSVTETNYIVLNEIK